MWREVIVMDFYGFVKKLVVAFTKEKIDYAFTGALAASFYAVPRTTTDVDVLVPVSLGDVKTKLASALRSASLHVDDKRIDDALTSGYRIATFRGKASPYRVDVIFSDQIRKRKGSIDGLETFFQVPEDLILAKLRMIKATVAKEKSQKDGDDVRAILRFTRVDKGAVEAQAKKDGTFEFWQRLSTE
jgi:hypothetical protein